MRLLILLALCMTSSAMAHLMVLSTGSIRIDEGKAYVAMAVPISAFEFVDQADNGQVLEASFREQRALIDETVRERLTIDLPVGPAALIDLIIQPETHYGSAGATVEQVTVMAVFDFPGEIGTARFETGLFGSRPGEKQYRLRVSRNGREGKQTFTLSPGEPIANFSADF